MLDNHHTFRQLRLLAISVFALIVLVIFLVSLIRSYTTGQGVLSGLLRHKNAVAAAQIDPSSTTLGFGKLSGAKTLSLTLKNSGTSTLVVESADPSCACITTELPKPIPIGGSGQLKVTLDPTHADQKGQQSYILTIHSNASRKPLLDIIVSAKIQ